MNSIKENKQINSCNNNANIHFSNENLTKNTLEENQPFLPLGGVQNAFLNKLVTEKILDNNYRLIKDVSNLVFPKANFFQQNIIKEFLEENINVTIQNEFYSFKVKDLLLFLYDKDRQLIDRIDIVGGLLRFLIKLSRDFCNEALKMLEIENADQLITADLLECPKHLHDVDIRFRAEKADESELGSYTISVLNYIKKISSQNLNYRPAFFTKFNKVNILNKTVYTIASFGEIHLKQVSTTKSELECIFAKAFEREYLFLQDALRVNILPLLLSNNGSLILDSYGPHEWQAFFDLLGKVIHINDPKSIDSLGLIMIASFLSKGFILGDDLSVLDSTISAFIDRFPLEQLSGHIQTFVSRSLKNHHAENPQAASILMFNLTGLLKGRISEEILLNAWSGLNASGSEAINHGIPAIIHLALIDYKIPYEEICAIIGLAGMVCLSKYTLEDKNPPAKLISHGGRPFMQVRLTEHDDSYLIVPFTPIKGFEMIKLVGKNKEGSQGRDLLPLLFNGFLNFASKEEVKEENLLAISKNFYFAEYEKLSHEAGKLWFKESSSFLRHISYHLLFSLGVFRRHTIHAFHLLPTILLDDCSRNNRSAILLEFANELSWTHFKFAGLSILELKEKFKKSLDEKFNKNNFLRLWINLLAQTQDPHLCKIACELYKTQIGKFSDKMKILFSIRLIDSFLPSGITEAAGILSNLQTLNLAFNISDEFIKINKLLAYAKEMQQSHLLLMVNILQSFIQRYQAEVNLQFDNKCSFFLDRLIALNFNSEAKKLIIDLAHAKLISKSDAQLLWIKICDLELKNEENPLASFEAWEKAKDCGIWTKSSLNDSYFSLVIKLTLISLKKNLIEKSYRLLKHLIKIEKQKEIFHIETKDFVIAYLNKIIISKKCDFDQVMKDLDHLFQNYLSPAQKLDYLCKIIEVNIEIKNFDKALSLYNENINCDLIENNLEKIAGFAERLLAFYLWKKKDLSAAASIFLNPNFLTLTRFFKEFWLKYLNQFCSLKEIENFNEKKLQCVFKLPFNCDIFNQKEEAFKFIGFLLDYLNQNSRFLINRPNELIHKISINIHHIFTLVFDFNITKLFFLISLLDKLKIKVSLNFQQSLQCLNLIKTVNELTGNQSPLPFENCLNILEKSETIQLEVHQDEFLRTYRALCTAHMNLKTPLRAIQWIQKILNRDPNCNYIELYLEWFKEINKLIIKIQEAKSVKSLALQLIEALFKINDLYTLKAILDRKILDEKSTPSYTLRYLLEYIKKHLKPKNLDDYARGPNLLLNNYSIIRLCQNTVKEWIKAITDQLFPLLYLKGGHEIFAVKMLEMTTIFAENEPFYKENPKKLFPVLCFPNERIKNYFFFSGIYRIEKILQELVSLCPVNNYIDEYLCENLLDLIKFFPKCGDQYLHLIDAYIFKIEPEDTAAFHQHTQFSNKLLEAANKKNLYLSRPQLLVKHLLFLSKDPNFLPLNSKCDNRQILTDLINWLLNKSKPFSTLIAIDILKKYQYVLLKGRHNAIKTLYSKLIDQIEKNSFSSYDIKILEEISSSLLSVDFNIFGATEKDFNVLNELSLKLYNFVKSRIDKETEALPSLKAYFKVWLIKFLHKSMNFGAFIGQKENLNYYSLLNESLKFTEFTITYFPETSIGQFLELCFNAICGIEDSNTILGDSQCESFSETTIKIRRLILNNWLQNLKIISNGKYIKEVEIFFEKARQLKLI